MNHPTALGKYQITGVLGEGAMGVVYKGFDPDIRRLVALKTIRHQLTEGSDLAASIAARFRNEAQAAGRLAHPGIVGIYEYGEDQQVAYIAMEYVEGQSVARYLASKVRFTDTDIPGLMSQLLDALDHAHSHGVWHRDIKPGNVILSRGGRLKVADFGIARVDAGGLTQTHTMMGTPAYMAPEQFLGATIDSRVDIYSAGVLLYVLLTGQPPFIGTTDSLTYRVVHEIPKPPSQIEDAQRPRYYDAILAKALAKNPADRYESALAFKDAIAEAIGQPIDATAWEETIIHVPIRQTPVGVDRPASGASSGSSVPQWDRTLLAQAESTLAHFVGPLATVLVKRAARECDSLVMLYQKLAAQMTDPKARSAFLQRVPAVGPGTGGTTINGGTGSGGTALAPPVALSETTIERAQQLLAQHVGPIARVLVRKAAAQSRDRATFILRLGEAVQDPEARARLTDTLERET